MCEHCGCQSFPLVKELTDEHAVIHDAIGALVRAVRAGSPQAPTLLAELLGLLRTHAAQEERSLFRELDEDTGFAGTVAALRAEHQSIYTTLDRALREGIDRPVLLDTLERLYSHIDKEEYGLFPAAVVLMGMDAWERATAAMAPPAPAPAE